MADELLGCPFCGEEMQLDCGIISHLDMIEASRRDCPLKDFVAASCLLDAWNTRAALSARSVVLEREACLDELRAVTSEMLEARDLRLDAWAIRITDAQRELSSIVSTAKAVERDACAEVAEGFYDNSMSFLMTLQQKIAAAIRARSDDDALSGGVV